MFHQVVHEHWNVGILHVCAVANHAIDDAFPGGPVICSTLNRTQIVTRGACGFENLLPFASRIVLSGSGSARRRRARRVGHRQIAGDCWDLIVFKVEAVERHAFHSFRPAAKSCFAVWI